MAQLANATDFSQTMRSIIVRDTMTTGVLTVYEGWSIRRLSKFFENHGVSGAPVIASDDELVGVVSQSDIIGFEARKPKEDEVKKIVERFPECLLRLNAEATVADIWEKTEVLFRLP